MSNIFSSVQFHDSAFHRSDWEGLLENKKSIWIAGVCGDEMGMRRAAQIKGPQQESRRPICPSFSVLCCSDSASWNSRYQGSKTRQFLFNVYCHFWIALSGLPKKKLCGTISLINLLPTSLRKRRPANSFPATDCCTLSHPANCWQPCVYIGNQIRIYLSWDMHKEYSPMSNLISM